MAPVHKNNLPSETIRKSEAAACCTRVDNDRDQDLRRGYEIKEDAAACLCVGVFLLRSGGKAVRAEMLVSLCPSVYL